MMHQLDLPLTAPPLHGLRCPANPYVPAGIAASVAAGLPSCGAAVWPASSYQVSQGPGLLAVTKAGAWVRCLRGHEHRPADDVARNGRRG